MNIASKRFIIGWPLVILLGLVCSLPALADGYYGGGGGGYYGDSYWQSRHPHRHHRHYGYGWQRPYYAPPPPRYLPPHRPPRYAPYPYPQQPGWQQPRHRDWR